jgi:putative endonuclease
MNTPYFGCFLFLRVIIACMGIFFRKNTDVTLSTGAYGEKIATKYLQNKGYKIIETNFKNPLGRQLGEIDIIAKKEGVLVFVEVKTRKRKRYENTLPEENITPKKLHKLNKAGQFYIKSKKLWEMTYRFDAISVLIGEDRKDFEIRHLDSIFY